MTGSSEPEREIGADGAGNAAAKRPATIEALVSLLRAPPGPAATPEEMDASIAEHLAAEDARCDPN